MDGGIGGGRAERRVCGRVDRSTAKWSGGNGRRGAEWGVGGFI